MPPFPSADNTKPRRVRMTGPIPRRYCGNLRREDPQSRISACGARLFLVHHRHGADGRAVGALHGQRERDEPAPRGADLVEVGQVLDDGDPDREERLWVVLSARVSFFCGSNVIVRTQ